MVVGLIETSSSPAESGAATEVDVVEVDTSVNNVDINTLSLVVIRVRIGVGQRRDSARHRRNVRDATETPGSVGPASELVMPHLSD